MRVHSTTAGVLALLVVGVVAGTPAAASAATITGNVQSGTRPLRDAPVTLYRSTPGAPAPTALGRARTDAGGRFSISYRSRAGMSTVVYLQSRGPAHGLVAIVPAGETSPSITIDELTTVAAGYALAQFVRPTGIAGRSPGLANAASMAANIADGHTGRASTVLRSAPNGSQTVTLRTVHSLANLVGGCVRSPSRCATLFMLARPPGGPTPRTLLEAVADIARQPAQHVRQLFTQTRTAPALYRPSLTATQAPDAWTVVLRFDGDGHTVSGPGNFAIDGQGGLWVLNNYVYDADQRQSVCGSDLLLKFTPDGRFAPGSPYTGGGVSGAGYGITFDPSGRLWLGNYGFATPGCDELPLHNSVSKFTQGGHPLSPAAGYTKGGISWPQGTVADRAGNLWIANCGNNTVTRFPHGNPAAARNIPNLGIQEPFDVGIAADGRAFVTGVGGDAVAVLRPNGTPEPSSPLTGGGLNHPMGIATDSTGHLWIANSGLITLPCPNGGPSIASRGGSLTELGRDGKPVRKTAFTGGGLTIPWGIAVDGADNVWVANFGKQRLSEFCGTRPANCPPGTRTGQAISPAGTGFGFAGLVRNTGVAIDPSGNVWVANNWQNVPLPTNPGGHQIVAYVGAARPVRTPLIGPTQPVAPIRPPAFTGR